MRMLNKEMMVNEIREIMKMPDGNARTERIAALLNDCSELAVSGLNASCDPKKVSVMYYAGMVANMHLLAAGLPEECSMENRMNFIETVCGLIGGNHMSMEEEG